MKELTTAALQLLQATEALLACVQTGELEQLAIIQQERATLVAELDRLSRAEWPDSVKAECREYVEKSRELEREVIRLLAEKRDAISEEHHKLQRNQQASKAYGRFS